VAFVRRDCTPPSHMLWPLFPVFMSLFTASLLIVKRHSIRRNSQCHSKFARSAPYSRPVHPRTKPLF
jgi:hypothetical protein